MAHGLEVVLRAAHRLAARRDIVFVLAGDGAERAHLEREAARLGLSVARKPDSQDICFVPAGSYADVVAKLRPDAMAPGEIVDEAGVVLGMHDGIARYTVGQAKRLGVAAQAGGTRRVVVGLDAQKRRVVVGAPEAGSTVVRLREVNWLVPPHGLDCTVKLRARDAMRPARVVPTANGAAVTLEAPALAAPGQACVFYDGDRVLGGGFICAA